MTKAWTYVVLDYFRRGKALDTEIIDQDVAALGQMLKLLEELARECSGGKGLPVEEMSKQTQEAIQDARNLSIMMESQEEDEDRFAMAQQITDQTLARSRS